MMVHSYLIFWGFLWFKRQGRSHHGFIFAKKPMHGNQSACIDIYSGHFLPLIRLLHGDGARSEEENIASKNFVCCEFLIVQICSFNAAEKCSMQHIMLDVIFMVL